MKGKAIAGLVLSIVGVVLAFLGTWFSVAALPVAIVGLVLAATSRKAMKAAGQPAGLGTAGLVVGIIATVFAGIFFFTCGICTICAAKALKEGAEAVGNIKI